MLIIDYNSYCIIIFYGKCVCFLVLYYIVFDFVVLVKVLIIGVVSVYYLILVLYDFSYKVVGFKGQCIFNLVVEEDCVWYVGVSGWVCCDNFNDIFIGIEIVNFVCDDDGVFIFFDYECLQINVFK